MSETYDVVVVGGGILGLAHAWAAARTGRSVAIVERHERAVGASIRNFGFVTVTGQSHGDFTDLAFRTRDLWDDVCGPAGITVHQRGLAVVARRDEAAAVLEAFLQTRTGQDCELLTPANFGARYPDVPQSDWRAVLMSPHERRIDPVFAIASLTSWLTRQFSIDLHYGHDVRAIDGRTVVLPGGRLKARHHVYVCAGDSIRALAPAVAAKYAVSKTTLQMHRTRAVTHRLPTTVMTDLSLARYHGYTELPESVALRARLEREQPEYLAHGIHLIAAQSVDGALTLGDSHRDGEPEAPFSLPYVDQLIRDEYESLFGVPAPEIDCQWLGTYAISHHGPWLSEPISDHATAVVVTCGAGMSTGLAIGERVTSATLG